MGTKVRGEMPDDCQIVEVHFKWDMLMDFLHEIMNTIEVWESLSPRMKRNTFLIMRVGFDQDSVNVSGIDSRQVIGSKYFNLLGLGVLANENNEMGIRDNRSRKPDTYPNFFE